MARRKYEQAHDGEWFNIPWKSFYEQCCGCSLIHKVDFKVVEGKLYQRATVDKRATAAARRNFKFPKEDDD